MLKQLLKGSFSFLFISNIGMLFSILILYLNGKILSAEDFGLISIALMVIVLMESFKQIGTKEYLIANRLTDNNEIMGAWSLDFFKSILLFIICVTISIYFSNSFERKELYLLIILLSFGFIFDGLSNPNFFLLRMNLEYRKLIKYNLIHNFFSAITMISFVIYLRDYKGVIIGYFFRAFYQFLFSYIYHPIFPQLRISKELFIRQFEYGKWIILSGILFYFTSRFDIFVLNSNVDLKELGFYTFAVTVVSGLIQKPLKSINNALFPLLAKNKKESNFKKVIFFTFISSLIFVSIVLVFGATLIDITFDGKWYESVVIIKILTISSGINALRLDSYFLVNNKTKTKFHIEAVRAFSVLILIFPLVLIYGIVGAAYSILIANIIGLIIWSIKLKRLNNVI